jgi:predicted dehydrogenase
VTQDYTTYPLTYRLRKAARYARLYGPSRTLVKVRGQYHMRGHGGPLETDWTNPKARSTGRDIAIIGCGNFAFSNIAYYCEKIRPGAIRCAYDPVGSRSVSLIRRYGGLYAAADPMAALDDPAVRTVFVASNHASHATYATQALRRGKIVHIEKPHVVSREQLNELIDGYRSAAAPKVFLGFNRPRSRHFRWIMDSLSRESGPTMANWFVAGHELDLDHWYFSPTEGGRILGNLCHWTDLTLRMIGIEQAFPVDITGIKPEASESDFAITMAFGDRSIGMISFSAKGHTFEGVREYLNVHKGNVLATLMDFHKSTIDVGEVKRHLRPLFRDHGHRAAIAATLSGEGAEPLESIVESANLFLGVKEAVETGSRINLQRLT